MLETGTRTVVKNTGFVCRSSENLLRGRTPACLLDTLQLRATPSYLGLLSSEDSDARGRYQRPRRYSPGAFPKCFLNAFVNAAADS